MAILRQRIRSMPVRISGVARGDRKTKHLIPRLLPGEIAVLAHEDLDEMAAEGLLAARVKAIVNTKRCMTGRYPNKGPLLLLQSGIPLFETSEACLLDLTQDGDWLTILDEALYVGDRYAVNVKRVTMDEIVGQMRHARRNTSKELHRFLDNTLMYAYREKEFFLGRLPVPNLRTRIKGKHVLVVVRGSTHLADLQAISHYIKEQKPVLVGVDGGADALLQIGVRPDMIVGDMDSVSDKALQSGAELIVHAYLDGRAPGLDRIERLGLSPHVYPAPGTSEDIAMLIADELGAELIVAVGTHTNMIDFLEKGRKGMASTLLTRLRVGPKLVDAKGVSQLYQTRFSWSALMVVLVATLVPVTIMAAVNPIVRSILRIFYWKIKLLFT